MTDWAMLWFNFFTNAILIVLTWYLGKRGVSYYQKWKEKRELRDQMLVNLNQCIDNYLKAMFEWNKFVDHVIERSEENEKEIEIDVEYEYRMTDHALRFNVTWQLFITRLINNFAFDENELNFLNVFQAKINDLFKFFEDRLDLRNWTKEPKDARKMFDELVELFSTTSLIIINSTIKEN